jgi:4-amino-4-deoxy-L-arabinose transferase-like glycosyltransferase
MSVGIQPINDTHQHAAVNSAQRGRESTYLALIAVAFAAALTVWHCWNHALPAPDDSSYILASFKYSELLHHPKFWKPEWWHAMLTVNQAYPPAVMMFNGVLRLFLGFGNWVNILSVAVFSILLTTATYGITRITTGDTRAGLIAAALINLYPEVSCVSHLFALDAPLLSMIACALFALVWWREKPSWPRSITCGVVFGLACVTKQIAAAFLIGPAAYFFVEGCVRDFKDRRFHLTVQLITVAVLTAALVLPWWLTNLEFIRHWANDNQTTMGHLTLAQVFPQRIWWYVCSLPSIMSPILLAGFVLYLPLLCREAHRALFPVSLSSFIGVSLISTLTWAFPSLRYDAPVLIVTAIYTGSAMSAAMKKSRAANGAVLIIALALVQFVSFNFIPYPISQPGWLAQASEALGVRVVEAFGLTDRDRRSSTVVHSTPSPPEDWGQEWCIKTIDSVQGHVPVFLNILPDLGTLNGNTFELTARTLGSMVRPTTSRRWTVMGDEVVFDPQTALNYHWYLLKTGNQGNLLRDDQSSESYRRLIDFVQHGERFQLIGTHKIADGSTLALYHQR